MIIDYKKLKKITFAIICLKNTNGDKTYSINNKILPTVLIIILVGSLSWVATSYMLYCVLPQAIAHVNKMLTYDNSTGIRMQYPSNWHKEENLSSGTDNNSMLVDVVKFISPTKNASDTSSESFDLKIDDISDIRPSL